MDHLKSFGAMDMGFMNFEPPEFSPAFRCQLRGQRNALVR